MPKISYNCFICRQPIEDVPEPILPDAKNNRMMYGLDKPYCNLYIHKTCFNSNKDDPNMVIDNLDYIYEILSMTDVKKRGKK